MESKGDEGWSLQWFDVFPIELTFVILSHLPVHDLLRLLTVNKKWFAFCTHNFLWKNLSYRYFGFLTPYTLKLQGLVKTVGVDGVHDGEQQVCNKSQSDLHLKLNGKKNLQIMNTLERASIAPLSPSTKSFLFHQNHIQSLKSSSLLSPLDVAFDEYVLQEQERLNPSKSELDTSSKVIGDKNNQDRKRILWYRVFRQLYLRSRSPIMVRNMLVDYKSGKILNDVKTSDNPNIRLHCFAEPLPLKEQGIYSIDGFLEFDTLLGKFLKRKKGLSFKSGEAIFTEADGSQKWKINIPDIVNCINIAHYETPLISIDDHVKKLEDTSFDDNSEEEKTIEKYNNTRMYDVIFLAVGNGITALDRVTGKTLWHDPIGPNRRIVVNTKKSLVAATDEDCSIIQTWNAETGERKWNINMLKDMNMETRSIVVLDGCFLFVSEEHRSLILDEEGQVLLDTKESNDVIKNFILIPKPSSQSTKTPFKQDKKVQMMYVSDEKLCLVDLDVPYISKDSMDIIWSIDLPVSLAMHHRFDIVPIPCNIYTFEKVKDYSHHAIICNYSIVYRKTKSIDVQRVNAETGAILWKKSDIIIQEDHEINPAQRVPQFTCRIYCEIRLNFVLIISQLFGSNRLIVLDVRDGKLIAQYKFQF